MDKHVKEYFSRYSEITGQGNFFSVIPLHDSADVNWETVCSQMPSLSKGWYELCQLTIEDRIQFSLDYWLTKIPYHPKLDNALATFFDQLDDIGVYLVKKTNNVPYTALMVYSLSGNRGFYKGAINASDDDIEQLKKSYSQIILPEDYLAFLQIHNGFSKSTDCTGIISTAEMETTQLRFQKLLSETSQVTTTGGKIVNPHSLIPFYESFGMPFFQCFWDEWRPEQEMGNVYFSSAEYTISDPGKRISNEPENLAFCTFTDWLVFYLEQLEI